MIIHNIDGNWLRYAKDVEIKNNILCANLRMENSDYLVKRINGYIWQSYKYNKDCIILNGTNLIKLSNNNGKLELYYGNDTYSRSKNLAKGSFYDSVNNVTHYYDIVCAYFYDNIYVMYKEKCIDFNNNDYLVNHNGNFKKLSYNDFIIYE